MSKQKIGLPKGVRDFGPEVMVRRQHIFDTARSVFQKFGFQPLETPAFEQLSVLTGKYGDEGDQLIFKILNSGDYLSKLNLEDGELESKTLTPQIAEKALKYDLTVPFARYVANNRNDITFPFRRYQIQPVWRADRPQRGRYREFYQCDADIVGTDSLYCEAEIILMIIEVFERLGVEDLSIRINNRKVLEGMAESLGIAEHFTAFTVAIDKLDKIGPEKVISEMITSGIPEEKAKEAFTSFLNVGPSASFAERLNQYADKFESEGIGRNGIKELQEVAEMVGLSKTGTGSLVFDPTLARGLSYYTGAIFEVRVNNVSIGSVCGGGRYDNLTALFGLPDMSGVGISFGVDRIYDVMEELKLFPEKLMRGSDLLIVNFDAEAGRAGFALASLLRKAGIVCEIYPDADKLKKQLNYANQKNIPYVVLLGSEEIKSGQLTLKNMESGVQENLTAEELIEKLRN